MDNYLSVHSLVTIDDKGRILMPIKIREALQNADLILTRGVEDCLWLFPSAVWQGFSKSIQESLSVFDANSRLIQRRILAPASEVTLDGTGRLKLTPSLMSMAKLRKECYLIGLGDRIEIWDSNVYDDYDTLSADRLEDAFHSLAPNSTKESK